jgi:hypothetical protein
MTFFVDKRLLSLNKLRKGSSKGKPMKPMQLTILQVKHLPQVARGSHRVSTRVEHASVGRGSCRAGSNRAEAPPERRPTVFAPVARGSCRAGSNLAKAPRERRPTILVALLVLALCLTARAQVNTGSDGSDGPLDYSSVTNATNVVIDMNLHPTGIYKYTYVNIPANVTVTFIPNASNTPVYWLVQSNVIINGTVNVSGQVGSVNSPNGNYGGAGGPGGYSGGNGAIGNSSATSGQGPGGGAVPSGAGSYNYGNTFLIPLIGGSGGAGGNDMSGQGFNGGGGGGGGAILVAASNSVIVGGYIYADGGGGTTYHGGGPGSGGAIRIVAARIGGAGQIAANNSGRVRFDTYDNEFTGGIYGNFSSGFQPIIIPTAGQLPQLTVTSVAGVPVSASPTGVLSTPDAVISAQQNNPVPIVVSCVNLPLNSVITVSVTPMNGSPVSAVGSNNTGTQASSTATVSLNMPRGGGLIYATAATSP